MKIERLLPLLLLCASPVLAQQTELPDLAPREVEITGDLTISFPALRRQPIVGFNPPPRVPDIPYSHQPYTEAHAQNSADLPASPLQAPDPPQVSAIERREPMSGLIDARVGAYLDRQFKADISLINSSSTTALINLDYFGTDGQDLIVSGTPLTTGRDHVSGALSLEQRAGPMVVDLSGSGLRSSYGLFGAIPAAGSPALADPDRLVTGFEAGLGLHNRPGARTRLGLNARTGVGRMKSSLFDPAVRLDPATEREMGHVTLEARAAFPVRDGEILFGGDATTTGLDTPAFPGSTVRSAMAWIQVTWQYSSSITLKGGAALLGYDGQSQTGADPARSTTWIAPIAGIDWNLSESTHLFASLRPTMDTGLMTGVARSQPVLMDEPILLPSVTTLDARIGLQVQTEMATASVSGGWRDEPFRRYAFETGTPNRGYVSGYPALGYGASTVVFSQLDVSVIPFTGFQIGVDMLWQQPRLDTTNDAVPYASPLVVGGFASLGLLDGDLEALVEWVHEASRPADLTGSTKIPALTRVNALVSWFFHKNYGMTTGIRDLGGDQQY
ncbi:MAG: TonB-dependent receptor, partial [Bacteroidota bacterium]|nr:TonB-dependent receptor [Bacteroidota bacterium]